MRIAIAALAVLSLAACSRKPADASAAADAPPPPTSAQVAAGPQASPDASGPASIQDAHPDNAGPPAAGANSFTETEARKHIEHTGYTDVSSLVKDANGVWHGSAVRNGAKVNVSVDFKGNVTSN